MPDPTPTEINERLAAWLGWHVECLDATEDGEGIDWWVTADGTPEIECWFWEPSSDRNDLAIVLEEVERRSLRNLLANNLWAAWKASEDCLGMFGMWLLTCPPDVVARAVAEVVGGET